MTIDNFDKKIKMMKDKSMDLDELYKLLCQIQTSMHSPTVDFILFPTLDFHLNDKYFEKIFNKVIHENKAYYQYIFIIYYFFDQKEKFEDLLNLYLLTNTRIRGHFSISDIFSCQRNSNNESNFVKTLIKIENNGLLNPILIDYISYNLIPTFFNYFIEKNSFNSFCSFIQELQNNFEQQRIKNNLHHLLSRPLFQSPLLTEFLHQTICPFFRPLFQNLLNTKDKKVIKDIQQNILSCMQQNIQTFPYNIKLFLEKFENKIDFLRECLINPMSSRPELFLISDYWNVGISDKESVLKEMIQKVFDEEMIENFLSSIFENKYFDKCFINGSEKVPIIQIKPMIKLDSFDIKCINLIQDFIEKIDKKELNDDDSLFSILSIFDNLNRRQYAFYSADFSLFDKDFYKQRQISIKDVNDIWLHFNRMIREGPPLPANVNFGKEKVTIESFLGLIERYLVETCDQTTIESQRLSFNFFKEDLLNRPKEQQYIQTKKSFQFKTQYIRKYSENETIESQLITQFYFDSIELELKQTHSIRLIELLVLSLSSGIIQFFPKKKPTKINYQLNPDIIYDNNVKPFTPDDLYDVFQSFPIVSVIMHRTFEGMTFSDFKSQRPELAKYDQIFDEAKSHSSFENLKNEAYFKSYIQTLFNEDNNDLFYLFEQEISKVFENNEDFISKSDNLSRIMKLFLGFVYDIYNIEGSDYTIAILIGLMCISNTPNFISNHVFISYGTDKIIFHYYDIVNTIIATSILSDYIDLSEILNKSLMNNKFVEIYIVGNDPELMISLFLMIKNLYNNKNKFCDNELTIIKDQIKSNPDPLISLYLNSNEDVTKYIFAEVVLCKFIRASKRQNFDDKCAIFAFSSNTNNNECLDSFIHNNHIKNQKKIIVYKESMGNVNTKNIKCTKYDNFKKRFRILRENGFQWD